MYNPFNFFESLFFSTDLATFPIPDPSIQHQFTFNDFNCFWEEGVAPNFEPRLYVLLQNTKYLVGRWIPTCKVIFFSIQISYLAVSVS